MDTSWTPPGHLPRPPIPLTRPPTQAQGEAHFTPLIPLTHRPAAGSMALRTPKTPDSPHFYPRRLFVFFQAAGYPFLLKNYFSTKQGVLGFLVLCLYLFFLSYSLLGNIYPKRGGDLWAPLGHLQDACPRSDPSCIIIHQGLYQRFVNGGIPLHFALLGLLVRSVARHFLI